MIIKSKFHKERRFFKIKLNQRQSLWRKRYCEEVRKMTNHYVYVNNHATTRSRKITADEIERYKDMLNKTDCHRLVFRKG